MGLSGTFDKEPGKSELQFQTELHRPRSMSLYGMEKSVACPAARRPRREAGTLIAVATGGVAGSVTFVGIVEDELSVVKKIEGFYAKL